jgi:tetratricopeptide (TPR) repeat protein
MRSLIFAAGIAALVAPTGAGGAVITVGGPLSRLCYESALARDARDSAIEGCTRSLDEEALSSPDRAGTLVNRGILEMVRRKDASAVADFDAAIALDGSLPDAWLNKGFILLRNGDGKDALPLLEQGIKRKPQREALAIFARGVAYEEMGDFRSAYDDLRRAHQLEPGWALPSQYLGHYRVVQR